MNFSQKIRAAILSPLLATLTKVGANPNQVSYGSLAVGILACPALYFSRELGLLLVTLHVLLDGLDGPLARFQESASNKGSFTDTFIDQIVLSLITITLINLNIVNVFAGGIYVFSYTLCVVFSMIRNAFAIPYSWLIRPRFIVYGWLLIEFYLQSGTINYLLWILNAVLLIKMYSGFLKIREKL